MSRTKGAKGKHNKEKVHKEKKKRGRPSKQHQHQKQNQKQIVNVNVNGGGGGGSKNTTIPVPVQLPSTIYDPSLITPYYGINDRQPTNPLTDAATDLMTPFIQSIISNQAQKVNPVPVSTNPTNPKKPPQTIPISQDDVKPVNPVIPKPIEQYVPNPQTDQSNPIPPEIIMDSNMSSSIHDKHMKHKNLEKEIKPQMPKVPKEPKPKKQINDPEGLGKIIPIENIGSIAGTVGAAALTGGATAAGEALLTGGTAGLMGAGESILGASIGSGVAAAASSALGNSTTGHIISGIAGGVVGRAVGRRTPNRSRNRNIENQELEPLLQSRTGQRLGGRANRNRLVDNEIQQSQDAQTGEITQWRIPPEIQPQTLLSRTARVLRNRAQNLSDTINNIRQQITGRITNVGRGRYSRLATNEEQINEEQSVQRQPVQGQPADEPPIYDITNEIMNPLNERAARIQRMARSVRTRRNNADRQYREQISREFDENIARSRNEEQQRQQEAINELDQILRQDIANRTRSKAAETIQGAMRNRAAVKKLNKRKAVRDRYKTLINSGEIQAAAARRGNIRDQPNSLINSGEIQAEAARRENRRINTAATTIQNAIRNRNAVNETLKRAIRKTNYRNLINSGEIEAAAARRENIRDQSNSLINSGEIQAAAARRENRRINATKIQKVVRGHISRNQLPEIMEEADRQAMINRINQVEQRANAMDKAAETIQGAMRNRAAVKELNKRKTIRDRYKTLINSGEIQAAAASRENIRDQSNSLINSGEIQAAAARRENRRINATNIQKVVRGHASRKDLRNEILKNASQEKTAATKIQSAIRNRTAKRDMMKQRQAVDEIKLKEMEAIKDQSIKDDAAKQLQAKNKRIRPQKDLSDVYKAKERIGANIKRLLTEKADSQYFPKTNRTMIWNNKTVGQPLVVSKKLKLVSKKKHDAAVEGYQNRQVFLDLADKYKDIMTKGKK